jgi:hypothetical protein
LNIGVKSTIDIAMSWIAIDMNTLLPYFSLIDSSLFN